jgi:hypothetical protein
MAACASGQVCVATALLDAGADVNCHTYDRHLVRAYHVCVIASCMGIDVLYPQDVGSTPLVEACGSGSAKLVLRLLDRGASVHLRVRQSSYEAFSIVMHRIGCVVVGELGW